MAVWARRRLRDALREDDGQALAQLQGGLGMTRFGVMKHLAVLDEAGLIVTRKQGRFKYHYLNALPLQQAIDRWIDPYRVKPAARAVLDLKATLEGPKPMSKPDFVMQTYIKCTQDALWDALTQPDSVTRYHFIASKAEGAGGGSGDKMSFWAADGTPIATQTVTAIDPKSRIDIHFAPAWEGPDMVPSRFVCLVEVQGDACCLTVEHYDLPPEQDGIDEGWARTLSGLKSWLESGQETRFEMADEPH